MIEKLKNNKKLLRLLTIIVLILACCNLPSLLFFPLCLKEDFFRPPHTEVLVSACKKPVVRGVPGGEVLFVHENLTDKTYLLDLLTGEKRNVLNDPLLLDMGIFLSPELVWLEGSLVGPDNPNYRPHYILDITTGQRYELVDLTWFPLKDGTFDTQNYRYFQSAERVFVHHSENILIALSSDKIQTSRKNVIFSQSSLGTHNEGFKNGELLVQLMKDLGVTYETVDFSLDYADVPSPTRKYIVRGDGIYLSETNKLIVNHDMGFYFRSWYYDESGVVFAESGYFLISDSLIGSHFLFPRPILKLNLPSQ